MNLTLQMIPQLAFPLKIMGHLSRAMCLDPPHSVEWPYHTVVMDVQGTSSLCQCTQWYNKHLYIGLYVLMLLFLLHKAPKLRLLVKALHISNLNIPCWIIFPKVVGMNTSASCVFWRLTSGRFYYSFFVFAFLINENGLSPYFDFLPSSHFICWLAICISSVINCLYSLPTYYLHCLSSSYQFGGALSIFQELVFYLSNVA